MRSDFFKLLPNELSSKGEQIHGQTIELADRYVCVYYDDKAQFQTEAQSKELLLRLLPAWLFHWEKRGFREDGMLVADALEKTPAGSPLSDIVFSEALYKRQSKAGVYFQEQYAPYLHQIGKRLVQLNDPAVRNDFGVADWIGELTVYLLDAENKAKVPLIRKYHGKVGIRHWLAAVLVNYVSNRRRVMKETNVFVSAEEDVLENAQANSADISMEQEKIEELRKLLERTYALLTPQEKMRLEYFYRDALTNQQIAAILGEDPALTTRRRQAAELHLAEYFCSEYQKSELYFWGGDLNAAVMDHKALAHLLFSPTEDQE